ncbi:MAG TPA: hypothetical protein VFN13_08010 [Rudaea sp.]|nr:hypothetical protein [Rudaea sp.]
MNFQAQIDSVKRSALNFGAVLAGSHYIKSFAANVIEANIAVTGWRYGLETATGSMQGAANALNFVRAESARLGIDLRAAASSFTQLSASAQSTPGGCRAARAVKFSGWVATAS